MAEDLVRLAEKFRVALESDDRAAANRMVGHYGRAWTEIRKDLTDINAQIVAARMVGEEVGPSWLYRQERYRTLMRRVETEMLKVSHNVSADTYATHSKAIESAQEHMADLVNSAPGMEGTFYETNPANARQLVGHASDGSPLKDLFRALPGDAGQRVENALVTALVSGASPDRLARSVRDALGGNMARAQTIARTETHRAYRETSRRSFEDNADVVKGWIWNAGLGPRTCAACYAMHGTKHANSERLDGHPRCRCSMVPYTGTFEVELGADLFKTEPESTKLAILGPQKLEAYHKGELDLPDLVGRKDDARWGSMRYERSHVELRRNGLGDAEWRLGKGLEQENPYPFDPNKLKVDPLENGLGGAHSKTVYRDENDKLWIFKPQEDFLAELDVATAKMQRLAGFDAPDVFTIDLNGQHGSIQSMFGTKSTRRNKFRGVFDPERLSPEDIAQVQRHQVFDWLISNHDGHADQFIRLQGRTDMIGVDKGQAFKFFGKDKLSYKYNPNYNNIGDMIYNTLGKRYAEGGNFEIGLLHQKSGRELKAWITDLQRNLPDETIRTLLRPYAEKAHAAYRLPMSVDDFLDAAVLRKNRLLKDVENYHVRLRDERIKALGLGRTKTAAVDGLRGMAGARSFATNQAGENWGYKNYASSALSVNEKASLQSYTGSGYARLNESLRLESGLSGHHLEMQRNLDKVFDRHPLPEDIIVNRGVGLDAFSATGSVPKVGYTYEDKGYMSTTTGPRAAFGSSQVQIRLRANKGTPAFFAHLVSSHTNETELLLGRGVKFYVHKVEMKGTQWFIDAEVVP